MGRINQIKRPEVSGYFYSDDPNELAESVRQYIDKGVKLPSFKKINAIIAPHAGHVYSGPIAGSAYRALEDFAKEFQDNDKRHSVLLLGPSHHFPLEGVAIHSTSAFATPLGKIVVDPVLAEVARQCPLVRDCDAAFTREHSLEVHFPFIQLTAPHANILPLLVGYVQPVELAQLLHQLMKVENTFLVVSSDLSHFHPYLEAQTIDNETSKIIEEGRYQSLSGERACGSYPLKGLLRWAKEMGLIIKKIDLRNSGDTAGDKGQVVGYGAYAVGKE